ncbi:MAG: hypothetical protein J7L42_05010 [Elusimicrobia bacterium]|nr:hypothetical protein [Elusimicrobiota bacterium]
MVLKNRQQWRKEVYLDVYIKTKKEFRRRVISIKPPVSTMLESYFVIYGKDPRNL